MRKKKVEAGEGGGEARSTKAPEGWRGMSVAETGRDTMPCSSIGLSDHIRSRSKRRDMGENPAVLNQED